MAFKSAELPLKLFIFAILIITHLTAALYAYEYLNFQADSSFVGFYLIYSFALILITIPITILQILFLGILLSFVSIFDNSGKFRRVGIHLEEIIRSLKPGGRKAVVGLPDLDDILS